MLLLKILELTTAGYTIEFTPAPPLDDVADKSRFTLQMWLDNIGVRKTFEMIPRQIGEKDDSEFVLCNILDETVANIENIFENSQHSYGEATKECHDEDVLTSHTCVKCGCTKTEDNRGNVIWQTKSDFHNEEPVCA